VLQENANYCDGHGMEAIWFDQEKQYSCSWYALHKWECRNSYGFAGCFANDVCSSCIEHEKYLKEEEAKMKDKPCEGLQDVWFDSIGRSCADYEKFCTPTGGDFMRNGTKLVVASEWEFAECTATEVCKQCGEEVVNCAEWEDYWVDEDGDSCKEYGENNWCQTGLKTYDDGTEIPIENRRRGNCDAYQACPFYCHEPARLLLDTDLE